MCLNKLPQGYSGPENNLAINKDQDKEEQKKNQ